MPEAAVAANPPSIEVPAGDQNAPSGPGEGNAEVTEPQELGTEITPQEPTVPEAPQEPPSEEKPPEGEAPKEAAVLYQDKTHSFKDDEEGRRNLAIAYTNSSMEGIRLSSELKQTQNLMRQNKQTIDQLRNQLEINALEREVGNFQEMTEDQLVALMNSEDPRARLKVNEYYAKRERWQERKDQIESRKTQLQALREYQQSDLKRQIDARFQDVVGNPNKYPDGSKLIPVMNQILDITEDEISGHAWTPEIVYLASYGYRQLQLAAASRESQKASEEKAKLAANAAATAAGGSGPTSGNKSPAGRTVKSEDDLSDDEFGQLLLRAGPKKLFSS